MDSFVYMLNDLKLFFQRVDVNLMLYLLFIYTAYFFFLMKNNRYKLEKMDNVKLYFFSLLMYLFFGILIFIFLMVVIYIKNDIEPFLTVLNSSYINYVLFGILFYFVILIYKVNSGVKQKNRAFQEILNFKVKPEKLEKITHKLMDDIPPFYEMKDGEKIVLENYKLPKLHKVSKELSNFKLELLKYLMNVAEDNKIKYRCYEMEILRLVEKITELKKDLIIGHFRSITETEDDEELIGSIYNLREKSISPEGYAYYITYINFKKDLELLKEEGVSDD